MLSYYTFADFSSYLQIWQFTSPTACCSCSEPEVPADALPEHINCPGGCKDYKCQLCAFQHTNRDCMLMHIWQHLEISIGCPMCGKGFQNVASLCRHGKRSTQSTLGKQKMNECIYHTISFVIPG